MSKYIKIKMCENKKTTCPICKRVNNHLYGNCCAHVDRVTVNRVVFYINNQ